jgi:hypothetical protein
MSDLITLYIGHYIGGRYIVKCTSGQTLTGQPYVFLVNVKICRRKIFVFFVRIK